MTKIVANCFAFIIPHFAPLVYEKLYFASISALRYNGRGKGTAELKRRLRWADDTAKAAGSPQKSLKYFSKIFLKAFYG